MKRAKHYSVDLLRLIRNSSLGYLMVIVLIFGAGLTVSIIYWQGTETRLNNNALSQYQRQLEQSETVITQSLQRYANLLSAGDGLLAADGNEITQSQWLTFFQSYNLAENYPGVAAVSFSQNVPAAELGNYLNNMSAQGRSNFTVTPAGSRSTYAPITYIGYTSPVSLQALGYDQLSNPVRGAAIDVARDTGKIALSGKISLIAADKGQPAFLMYLPVYEGPNNTIAERQASIYGYVFIAINNNSFFDNLLKQYVSSGVGIQVFDGTKPITDMLMYQTPGYATVVRHTDNKTSVVPYSFGEHPWTIKVVIDKRLLLANTNQSPTSRLYLGIALSAVLATIVWYFTAYRERKITWQQQHELQAAKDDLLSLASHQLRTPATIVKQYLGILLQDYAGSITKRQRSIIKTAYESNERQLEIANQFLNAARLGSGRITLSKETVNIDKLLKQVVNDQQKIAKEKVQIITYRSPKKTYEIQADPHYLPMVFENLLSNAIKYSNHRGKITVSVRKSHENLLVSVADNGIGIKESEQTKLFDKFSRIHNDMTADANGSGIGLYLVKQIVNLHNGNITIQSKLGNGSKFIVLLPLNNNSDD
jgi:signal transduction histidine kinase